MPREPASSPAAAREVLKAVVERAVAAGLAETSIEPVHTLIPAPPGLGKTEAALIALTTPRAMINRLSVLSPTVPLSEELAKRHPLTSSPDECLRGAVRHHKGRQHYCDMPAFDRLARQLEKIGRSPLKPVCGHCPKRDVCPWPAQQADVGAGIIFGQHAHATTSMRRTKAGTEGAQKFTIVDEAPTDTLLAPNKWPRHIAALRRINRQVRILNANGLQHVIRTADLTGYRKEILDALAATDGRLKFEAVAGWRKID